MYRTYIVGTYNYVIQDMGADGFNIRNFCWRFIEKSNFVGNRWETGLFRDKGSFVLQNEFHCCISYRAHTNVHI